MKRSAATLASTDLADRFAAARADLAAEAPGALDDMAALATDALASGRPTLAACAASSVVLVEHFVTAVYRHAADMLGFLARVGPAAAEGPTRSSPGPGSPRYDSRVVLRIYLFEDCSAFTHVAACTLALPPYFVARLSEGFRHFVTAMPAPAASGWSGCQAGLTPAGTTPPFHGARRQRQFEPIASSRSAVA